jgi:hypothetical protein
MIARSIERISEGVDEMVNQAIAMHYKVEIALLASTFKVLVKIVQSTYVCHPQQNRAV